MKFLSTLRSGNSASPSMPSGSPDQASLHYAFKASLIGSAHQFELTGQGLSWHIAGRSGLWRYEDIAGVRLSFRPVSMQAQRFRADISNGDGGRLSIFSTSWQTAALMAPQSKEYRDFILELHARMAKAGGRAVLAGGLHPRLYAAAIVCVVLVAIAMGGLMILSVASSQWAGALFLAGFAALFAWQVGGFVARNKPLTYSFGEVPKALLP